MKKVILVLLCALSCTVVFAKTSFKKGQTVYVAVKQSAVKSGTGFFASTAASVTYGDQLVIITAGDKKTEVKLSDGKTGWIATGSLTAKKIVKTATGSTIRASTDELALAGKGFSEEAENAYKAANKKLDFSKVDAIEKITVSESEVQDFIKEGHLNAGGAQ